MIVRRFVPVLLALVATLVGGAHADTAATPWGDARQMIVVTTADWNADHGTLRTFERKDGRWQVVNAGVPVTIGKAGAAWGTGLQPQPTGGPLKREGDNRSPAGVFRIGTAFGYAPQAPTALPYRALSASDWCVDVSGAAQYNRIVDTKVVGAAAVEGSTEPMRRDLHADGDQRYRLGFVIEHNTDAVAHGGSCIFAHLWASPTTPTTGCTAMAPAVMASLLAWLRPRAQPVFVLLPRDEYRRLQVAWQLPADAADAAQ